MQVKKKLLDIVRERGYKYVETMIVYMYVVTEMKRARVVSPLDM